MKVFALDIYGDLSHHSPMTVDTGSIGAGGGGIKKPQQGYPKSGSRVTDVTPQKVKTVTPSNGKMR